MDFHLGFTPHSTQCWVTPHIFSMNGVTDKAPIPHNSSTFLKILLPKMGFLSMETPHSTHILCHFKFYTHITPTLTNFTPFCAHTIPHKFSIFDPPFHTKLFSSMLLHILAELPPRGIYKI